MSTVIIIGALIVTLVVVVVTIMELPLDPPL